jgi:hypothetical protein
MFEFWFNNRAIIQYGVIVLLAVACWVWGRAPERIAGSVFVSMPLGDVALHALLGPATTLTHTDLPHAFMQAFYAVPYLGLALFANRRYPLWLVAFQLIAVLTHLVRNLLPPAGGVAYYIMTVGPSYGMIVALAAGLMAHRMRSGRFGPYRSWRTSSLRLRAIRQSNSPEA